jgi:hypothetical protein
VILFATSLCTLLLASLLRWEIIIVGLTPSIDELLTTLAALVKVPPQIITFAWTLLFILLARIDTAVLHAERHAVFSGLESIVVAQTTPVDKLRAMLSLRVVVPLRIVPFARS